MPKQPTTHGEFRYSVCVVCQKKDKPKNLNKITEGSVQLDRIKKWVMLDYNPKNQKLPGSICSRCRNLIGSDPTKLPKPDYSSWEFPSTSTDRLLENTIFCTCTMCNIARENCGQLGNTCATDNFGRGRPSTSTESTERTSSMRCDTCLQKIGPGTNHPKNCKSKIVKNVEPCLDQRAKDIITTNNYKQKVSTATEGAKTVPFATQGTPMNVPLPAPRYVSRALFKDSEIPIEQFNKMKTDARLSGNQANIIGHYTRRWTGRKSFESNMKPKLAQKAKSLKDYFKITQADMDSSLKVDKQLGSKVKRYISYTDDFPGLVNHIKNVRGLVHPMTRDHLKIFIDSGSTSLKFSFTIDKIQTDICSPVKSKARTSYSDEAYQNKNKNSGVNRLIVAGIVEYVTESYDNLKTLKELIDIDVLRQPGSNTIVTYHVDKKEGNEHSGIAPNSSAHPCGWCDMAKRDFENDVLWVGGNLRTLKMIRDNAKKFQEYKQNYKGSKSRPKPSSKDFFNCEHEPLFDGPGDTVLLIIVVPGKLHFRLGVVNDIFDILESILMQKKCAMTALDWSNALGMTRGFQYGAKLQFNGRQCKKLLNNLDILKDLLKKSNALELCMPVLQCLESYKAVEEKCFGMNLDPCYKFYTMAFGDSYRNLMKYVRSPSLQLTLNVTVKVHGICCHVPQFFELMLAEYGLNFGLAYYTEEVGETVHYDYDTYWVDKKYKRDLCHKDYAQKWHECHVHYCSDHEGRPSKPVKAIE